MNVESSSGGGCNSASFVLGMWLRSGVTGLQAAEDGHEPSTKVHGTNVSSTVDECSRIPDPRRQPGLRTDANMRSAARVMRPSRRANGEAHRQGTVSIGHLRVNFQIPTARGLRNGFKPLLRRKSSDEQQPETKSDGTATYHCDVTQLCRWIQTELSTSPGAHRFGPEHG